MFRSLLVSIVLIFSSIGPILGMPVVQNTIQITTEYDDNVIPINVTEKGKQNYEDFLLRVFYQNKLAWEVGSSHIFNTKFSLGGKKYLPLAKWNEEDEDTLIGQLGGRYLWKINRGISLQFIELVKTQYIRGANQISVENGGGGILSKDLFKKVRGEMGVGYLFFYYNYDDSEESLSFFAGKGNLGLMRAFWQWYSWKISYSFQRRDFSFSDETDDCKPVERIDTRNEVSIYMRYLKKFLLRIGYTFQYSFSDTWRGSFNNHIFQLNFSKRIVPRVTFLFMGMLQMKFYGDPRCEINTNSGNLGQEPSETFQKFEDRYENFNTLETKILYELKEGTSLVLSYSFFFERGIFRRSLIGLGLSIDF